MLWNHDRLWVMRGTLLMTIILSIALLGRADRGSSVNGGGGALSVGEPGVELFPGGAEAIFPELEGWKKEAAPTIYSPETLFDHIDGGAELYLSYGFVALATMRYVQGRDRSLDIDVYAHESIEHAFGIYSHERTRFAEFLGVGNEGYYEKGILNFYQGRFYVKMMVFGTGEEERGLLTKAARMVSKRLGEVPGPPLLLRCLPAENMVSHSERFVASDFLGHSFLEKVFVAEYRWGERNSLELFLTKARSVSDARGIVMEYLDIAGSPLPDSTAAFGSIAFVDSLGRGAGPVLLRWKGGYIWGAVGRAGAEAEKLLETVAACIESLEKGSNQWR